jgi:hypothetical protein
MKSQKQATTPDDDAGCRVPKHGNEYRQAMKPAMLGEELTHWSTQRKQSEWLQGAILFGFAEIDSKIPFPYETKTISQMQVCNFG